MGSERQIRSTSGGFAFERPASGHHQHIEYDHWRQADDRRPDAQCPENVLGGKALWFRTLLCKALPYKTPLFRDWIPFVNHDAPAFLLLRGE